MKEYQKPEIDFVSLVAEEMITSGDQDGDIVGGDTDLESSIW